MNIYEVGGTLRDSLLGKKHKDIDLAIDASSFKEMKDYVLKNSRKIFLEKPEFGTIRYMSVNGNPEDISLCIKSRNLEKQDFEIGTIQEDLQQRDFTINAIARNIKTGEIIDPTQGALDIESKIIRCTQKPELIFKMDPIRIIRAIRFKIELSFKIDPSIEDYFKIESNFEQLKNQNRERLRQEIGKCFKFSTTQSIIEFTKLGPFFIDAVFTHHKIELHPK